MFLKAWLLLLLLARCGGVTPELLTQVNNDVNAHPYGQGYVCRQYVRDKYLALRRAGVSASSMRVIDGYTYDGVEHVVLMVNYGGETYFLDNRHAAISGTPGISRRLVIDPESELWRDVAAQ